MNYILCVMWWRRLCFSYFPHDYLAPLFEDFSLLPWIPLEPLLKTSWLYTCGSLSEFSALLHWSVYPYSNTILSLLALITLFFFKMVWLFWVLSISKNFRISLLISFKKLFFFLHLLMYNSHTIKYTQLKVCSSLYFDNCVYLWNCHYNHGIGHFITLKILSCLFAFTFLAQQPTDWLCSGILYTWTHTMYILLCPDSFAYYFWYLCCIYQQFVPFYCCVIFHYTDIFVNFLLVDRFISRFRLLWIKVLWTFVDKSLCRLTFSFLLSKYLRVELLGDMINVY